MIEWLIGTILMSIAAAGLWFQAQRKERERAEIEARNRAVATKERITDAVENSHAGGAAWIDRLRADDKRRGNL